MSGMVHIYTGNGKGKTSAALGLALRAAAYNNKTYVGQFMKGQSYGELTMSKNLEWLVIEQYGADTLIHVKHPPDEENVKLALKGLEKARDAMLSKKYNIIILDEIFVAEFFNLISVEDIIDLIDVKPQSVELVLTGRYANKELYDKADLITEMEEIKHYYSKGLKAREGIEK